ncbi:flippase [Psychrobacter sp. GP33]|uniref:flippase n=1 Tax=Psychrobacter sp. GP33 TaxID=2758709 RepID=UPI0015FB2779|nr:flippase [Psychrobacter sp. GP33]
MINKVKALISRVNKSKDGKVLASNFGYLMLLQIAGYVFPLITIPYLARVIGVEGFGKIAFAAAVVVWFQTVSDWGFNYTATRDIARNRDNPEKVSEIFSNVLWARILLMLLSFVILMVAVNTIPYFKENQTILLVTFLLVPGHILFPEWFFQAMERMKFITLFSLISKAIFTILVFVFIKEKSDFILQPLFISLGYILSGIFSIYLIVVKWKVKIFKPHWQSIYKTIKNSSNVFITNITPNLYNSLAIVLLGFWGGSVANGIYDAGRKFITLAHSFMAIIIRVVFPFLSRSLDKHKLFTKIYLLLSVIGTVVLFFISPIIIKLFFTKEFYDAETVLKILSFSIFFVSLNRVYGTNYLIIKGFEKELRNITFACSILGFIISIPLVYYYSYIGAALTLVATQAILGFTTMFKALSVERKDKLLHS